MRLLLQDFWEPHYWLQWYFLNFHSSQSCIRATFPASLLEHTMSWILDDGPCDWGLCSLGLCHFADWSCLRISLSYVHWPFTLLRGVCSVLGYDSIMKNYFHVIFWKMEVTGMVGSHSQEESAFPVSPKQVALTWATTVFLTTVVYIGKLRWIVKYMSRWTQRFSS